MSRCAHDRPGMAPSGAPQRCADVARVGDRTRPVDLAGLVQALEQDPVKALSHARLLPLAQPPPARSPLSHTRTPAAGRARRSRCAAHTGCRSGPGDHRAACGLGSATGAVPVGSAVRPPPQLIGNLHPATSPPPTVEHTCRRFRRSATPTLFLKQALRGPTCKRRAPYVADHTELTVKHAVKTHVNACVDHMLQRALGSLA